MFYKAIVVVRRRDDGAEPAGMTEMQITSEIEAGSWGEAANWAAQDALNHAEHGSVVTLVTLRELRG